MQRKDQRITGRIKERMIKGECTYLIIGEKASFGLTQSRTKKNAVAESQNEAKKILRLSITSCARERHFWCDSSTRSSYSTRYTQANMHAC